MLITVVYVMGIVISEIGGRFGKPPPREITVTLEDRLSVLTQSLNSAARTISEIEAEVNERQALVAKLARDAQVANNVQHLNKEQVDPIAQVLRGQIDREQRESFWSSQLLALFYTVLGVVLAELFRWIVKRRKHRLKVSPQLSE
jgi:hypothetical protein